MTVYQLQNKLAGTLAINKDDEDLQDLMYDGVWNVQKVAADGAAGTDYTYALMKVPFDVEIVEVTICPDGTLTANDTNYATISLNKSDGAAGSATAVASQTTKITGGSGNWAARTFVDVPVTAANKNVDDGQMLEIESVKAASGVAVPICGFTIRYRRR